MKSSYGKENNAIQITCECNDFLPINQLVEFQGNLKNRTDDDIRKIVKSIKKHGFSFPFYVWTNDGIHNVLDGHGRLLALKKLDELGYLIPELPVVYVHCRNGEDAKDLLLRLNSQYGKMTKESVLAFVGDYDFDFSEYNLPEFNISFCEDQQIPEKREAETKPNYNVIVQCDSESEQDLVYQQLKEHYLVKRA